MRKKLITLAMTAILLMGSTMTVCASGNTTVTFTETESLEYTGVDFYEDGTPKLSNAFEGIAPGETVEQTITMYNASDKTVDFYMNASVLQALEESSGQAKGAGYAIKLTAGENILYDSNVGGYADSSAEGSKEGILEMNEGALEGYVLAATLAKGESEDIKLSIFFDGEAMDNNSQSIDYSNTFGQLAFSFQVSYEEPEGPVTIYKEITKKGETKYVTEIVEVIEERVVPVLTGDNALIGFAVAVLVFGVGIVILTGRKKKEEK